jgi:hypothetical protein
VTAQAQQLLMSMLRQDGQRLSGTVPRFNLAALAPLAIQHARQPGGRLHGVTRYSDEQVEEVTRSLLSILDGAMAAGHEALGVPLSADMRLPADTTVSALTMEFAFLCAALKAVMLLSRQFLPSQQEPEPTSRSPQCVTEAQDVDRQRREDMERCWAWVTSEDDVVMRTYRREAYEQVRATLAGIPMVWIRMCTGCWSHRRVWQACRGYYCVTCLTEWHLGELLRHVHQGGNAFSWRRDSGGPLGA